MAKNQVIRYDKMVKTLKMDLIHEEGPQPWLEVPNQLVNPPGNGHPMEDDDYSWSMHVSTR